MPFYSISQRRPLESFPQSDWIAAYERVDKEHLFVADEQEIIECDRDRLQIAKQRVIVRRLLDKKFVLRDIAQKGVEAARAEYTANPKKDWPDETDLRMLVEDRPFKLSSELRGGPVKKDPDAWMTDVEFDEGDFRPTWLVKGALVLGEPGVIAGPMKTMKTSIAVDLALALTSGSPFLNRYEIPLGLGPFGLASLHRCLAGS